MRRNDVAGRPPVATPGASRLPRRSIEVCVREALQNYRHPAIVGRAQNAYDVVR